MGKMLKAARKSIYLDSLNFNKMLSKKEHRFYDLLEKGETKKLTKKEEKEYKKLKPQVNPWI